MVARLVIVTALSILSAPAWAGPTKHVGKELTKGVGEEVKNQASQLDIEKGARQVGGGLVSGIHAHDKDASATARVVGRAMAEGFLSGVQEHMSDAFDCRGSSDAACIDKWVNHLSYTAANAIARGGAEGAPPWPSVLVFAFGLATGLVAAAIVALLMGIRRIRRAQTSALQPRPA